MGHAAINYILKKKSIVIINSSSNNNSSSSSIRPKGSGKQSVSPLWTVFKPA